MISHQIAISYQFLLSEILDTLDILNKSDSIVLPQIMIPTTHSSIHQLVPFWEAYQIPHCFKGLFVRLHQFLQLQREEGDLSKLCHRLESHSQKITYLLRAGETLSAPLFVVTKELAYLLLQSLDSFADDETVLFFVMRHSIRIDGAFSIGFSFLLLNSIFPEGIESLRAFIHKRYQAKGYGHLHPLIDQYLKALSDA